jgi:imidazolonepropionase-like amidohydrolase
MFRSTTNKAILAGAVLLALLGCHAPVRPTVAMPVAGKLRLDGVTIVDTHDGKLIAGMSILMDQGRIVAITPTAAAAKDSSIPSVDASGKFVVPGYNDMHVHVLDAERPASLLALMLSEGITGFRQMSGSPEFLKQRREHTLAVGKLAPALLAMPGSILTPFDARSPQSAAGLIKQQKSDGADFIKIGLVSPEVFYAAIADAQAAGLPAVGHLQEGVDAAQASKAGFRSIEHLGPADTIWDTCSTNAQALLADAAAHPLLKAPPINVSFLAGLFAGRLKTILINPAAFAKPSDVARLQRALDTYSDQKCRALAATFVANHTWNVPTLVRLRTQYLADAPDYASDPALRSMNAAQIKKWQEVTGKFRNLPPAMLATFRQAYPRELALTKLFDDAGVPMMTGTDNGGDVPGQSLHQEFDELAKAGLSPLKILQMTTIKPAEFLDRTATMGSVDAGKNADLVLLDASPIDAISGVQNMHKIAGVVRAGFYYSPADLQSLKVSAEAAPR